MKAVVELRRFYPAGRGLLGLASPDQEAVNRLYRFWKEGWRKTLESQGVVGGPSAPEFCRFDQLLGLFHNQEPIAAVAMSLFDLNLQPHREMPYFHKYPESLRARLSSDCGDCISTMEFLYVDPNWRAKAVTVSLSVVLCLIGLLVFQSGPAEALVTIPRRDRGIAAELYKYGAVALAENVDLYNSPVDFVRFSKDQQFKNDTPEIRAAYDLLVNAVVEITRRDGKGELVPSPLASGRNPSRRHYLGLDHLSL